MLYLNFNDIVMTQVVCRFRPLNKREKKSSNTASNVVIDNAGTGVKVSGTSFTFDQVYGEKSTQEKVYDYTAKPLVTQLFEGPLIGSETTTTSYIATDKL